jgi:tetratricopeptide (TPR) repeat protein/tRNA A-37 threonylcarbamoyl transferase component Bud32
VTAAPFANGISDLSPGAVGGQSVPDDAATPPRTPAERRHELVSELFLTVCNLSVTQQQELLAQGHIDPTIASEVLAMLGAEQRHADVMDSPIYFADEVLAQLGDPSSTEPLESQIGPYRIGNKLGEGACAVVYRAEQERPIQRTVAVKVLRSGLDGGAVRSRFEMERMTLAKMRHPHIAQLYDAGLSELGRPYFAMELVEGLPIVEYCIDSGLSTRDRISLFLQVCDAVQHAHVKGVVHRDLKPSNVLVTQVDARPFAKVIDFGIARALEAGRETGMRWTMPGDVVGTLEYMSPEQARGDLAAVDMLSDVYSLGVILYEMLCGRRPFSFTGVPVHVAVRRLLEESSPRLGADDKTLRGDLELIVARAMSFRPQDRYAGVAMLADDLRRWLRGEAISVRPDSALQRMTRLARRHRTVTAAAAAILVTLIAASAVSGVAWWRARNSYLATVSLVEGLLGDALELVDAIGDTDLQRSLFHRSLAAADAHLERSPGDRRVHVLRLRALDGLGDLDLHDGLFRSCRERRAALLHEITSLLERWPGDPDLRARLSIATVKNADIGHMLVPPVNPMPAYLEALAIDESLAREHPENAHYLDNLCWSFERVAAVYHRQGRVDEAVDLHRRRLDLAEKIISIEPDSHLRRWNLIMAHANMASVPELTVAEQVFHVTQARAEAERIASECPQNRLYLFYLAQLLNREATALESLERGHEASALRLRAAHLMEAVGTIDRQALDDALIAIEQQFGMASILSATGRIEDAIAELSVVHGRADHLLKTRRTDQARLIRLSALSLQQRAMLQQRIGSSEAASDSARDSADKFRGLDDAARLDASTAMRFAHLLASFPDVANDPQEPDRVFETALNVGADQPEVLAEALEWFGQFGDDERANAIRVKLQALSDDPQFKADGTSSDDGDLVGGS